MLFLCLVFVIRTKIVPAHQVVRPKFSAQFFGPNFRSKISVQNFGPKFRLKWLLKDWLTCLLKTALDIQSNILVCVIRTQVIPAYQVDDKGEMHELDQVQLWPAWADQTCPRQAKVGQQCPWLALACQTCPRQAEVGQRWPCPAFAGPTCPRQAKVDQHWLCTGPCCCLCCNKKIMNCVLLCFAFALL